jgi:xylan 1,4-beta-xylosidase
VNYKKITFQYKEANKNDWNNIDKIFDTTKYSDEYSQFGEFTATFCGIFVMDSNKREKMATFDYFQYNDL